MSDMEHYQGSQAFNNSLQVHETVNPSTGSLTISLPLAALKGITAACDLNLGLTFTGSATPILGLPAGWSLGLPYIVNEKVLVSGGRSQVIDENWSDQHGYKSGLRYENNHGIHFERCVEAQPTPSGTGYYQFHLRLADWSRYYFDMSGKLIEQEDRFGNRLTYKYFDEVASVFDNTLISVQDSFGQVTRLSYDSWRTTVELPNGSKTVILSGDDINGLENALGQQTSFHYDMVAGRKVISEITYPNGLETQIRYDSLWGRTHSGDVHFPAVKDLTHRRKNHDFLDRTEYTYGEETGGNCFTGAQAGYKMSGSGDSLMDSHDLHYRYDVTQRCYDQQDAILTSRRGVFNYLHLPLELDQHLDTAPGPIQRGRRTTYVYPEFLETHARTTNYTKPLESTAWEFSDTLGDYVPLTKTTNSYDLYGEVLETTQWLYDRTTAAFSKQMSESFERADAPNGRRMTKRSTIIDAISGVNRSSEFTPTADGNSIAEATLYWAENNSDWKPSKTKSFAYDPQGRLVRWQLQWADKCDSRPGEITETWGEEQYAFAPKTHQLTVTTKDAEGGTSQLTLHTGMSGQPILATRSALGHEHRYEYDQLGRVCEARTPDGGITRHTYELIDGNSITKTTGPAGYVTENLHDELGRLIRVTDNGDPTTDGSQISRVLSLRSYNALGQIVESTDERGLKTQYSYDALGRLLSSLDVFDNKTEISYADLATHVHLNGELRMIRTEDGAQRVTSIQSLPTSGHGTPTSIHYQYDGLGAAIGESHREAETLLSETSFKFDAEGKISHALFKGYGDHPAQVDVTPVRDLLGAIIHRPKSTLYNDGTRFDHAGNKYLFDRLGRPKTITDPKGGQESFTYYADSQIKTRTRPDGTVLTYRYDPMGRVSTLSWPGGEIRYDYTKSGRVHSISDASGTLTYEYHNGGSLKSVTYPDGRTRQYKVDAKDRVTQRIDPADTKTEISYDALGRISRLQQGSETLTYQYGAANGIKGALIGIDNSNLRRGFEFDGFGGLATNHAVDAEGKELLHTQYERDAFGRIKSLSLRSATTPDATVNHQRSFLYDGLGQLRSDGRSQYRFDGNSNLIEIQDQRGSTLFSYDALDRLQSDEVSFDANGRMIADGSGHHFDYDPLDRLIAVRDGAGKVLARHTYLPNGALAETHIEATTRRSYFENGVLDAVQDATGWTSYLVNDGDYYAAQQQNKPTRHYVKSNASTALTLDDGTTTGFAADAYGVTDKAGPDIGWNQETADDQCGLVYLRSRWYSPHLKRFMTPDRLLTDNRYAYCDGDPINRVDPTGESWETVGEVAGGIAQVLIPLAISAVFSITAGAATAKLLSGTSLGATATAHASTSVSSIIGTAAGEMTDAAIKQNGNPIPRDLGRFGGNMLIGFASGNVATFVGNVSGHLARLRLELVGVVNEAYLDKVRFTFGGLIGGVSGALTSAGLTTMAYGQPPSFSELLGSVAWAGFRDAAVGRYWHGRGLTAANVGTKVPALSVAVVGSSTPTSAALHPQAGERVEDYRQSPPIANGQTETSLSVPPGAAGVTLAGAPQHAFNFARPVRGSSLAEFLAKVDPIGGPLSQTDPAKSLLCYGSLSDGRLLAESVGEPLFAGYGMSRAG